MRQIVYNFPGVFFVIYMLAAFVWPSVRVYKRTGIKLLTFGASDSAHDYIGKTFKAVLIVIPLSIIVFYSNWGVYKYLLPVYYLDDHAVKLSGLVLCLLSLAWTVAAQWQMGNSWRIGIDEQRPACLVTGGLFSLTRNPIFLGMIVTLIGLFLLLPNAVTFITMVLGYILMQIQARLEEEFLSMNYGAQYTEYKRRVPRFTPLLNKLISQDI